MSKIINWMCGNLLYFVVATMLIVFNYWTAALFAFVLIYLVNHEKFLRFLSKYYVVGEKVDVSIKHTRRN